MRASRFHLCYFAIFFYLLPATAAAQQVMFSSLGPGNTFMANAPSTICSACQFGMGVPQAIANGFTANGVTLTGRFDLIQIDVAVGPAVPYQGGTLTEPFVVQIAADGGGFPGTVLETWNINTPSPVGMLYTLKDTLNIRLVAGQQYWVMVEPGTGFTADGWYQNTEGGSPLVPYAENYGSGWHATVGTYPEYFDVLANGEGLTPPPVGPAFGEYVHFVAGPVTPPIGGPVELTLGFVDVKGNSIGPTITSAPLSAGQFASLDLGADALGITRLGQRAEVRPVVTAQSVSGTPVAAAILASSEVVDRLMGIGSFEAEDSGPIQLLGASPVFAPTVLAGGEALRLVVMTISSATFDARSVQCNATLSFADINGNPIGPSLPVSLSPGTIATLDLTAQTLGLTFGQRMDVQPIVTATPSPGPQQTPACRATAEVFDQATGRTHVFQTARTGN